MTDLCDQPAHELVRAMQAADVSSREVVQAHLDRIARVNPSLNALVEASDPEVCLTEAAEADAAIAAERRGAPLGRPDRRTAVGGRHRPGCGRPPGGLLGWMASAPVALYLREAEAMYSGGSQVA